MGIEAKDFSLDLDLLAYSGIVFSPEQRASLQTALVILKDQYKFKTVHLWGKILGISDDYYIVQGRQKDELKDRQFLYRFEFPPLFPSSNYFLRISSSKDCINWNMLTPASDEAKELTQLCQGRFTGDPAHDFEVTKYNISNEDTEEENIEEYKVILVCFPLKIDWLFSDFITWRRSPCCNLMENRTGCLDHST